MLFFLVLLFWYLSASVATFFTYMWDESRARASGWRVKEKTLHRLELIGGWPGGLVGQRVFKHKRRKAAYMRVFYAIVAGHVGLWVLLLLARYA